MEVFNALWDNAEQRKRPPDDNFQLFTMEEWFAISSTHKILSGSFKNPLPPELEPADETSVKNSNKKSVAVPPLQRNSSEKDGAIQPFQGTLNPMRAQTSFSSGCTGERCYIPGITKLESSRMSSLTIHEHRDFLTLWQKFDKKAAKDILPIERAEYQLYLLLLARVKEEQKEYLELAKSNWPSYILRTTRMRGDPNLYVLTLWRDKVQRAKTQYSNSYRRLKVISLDHKRKNALNMHLLRNVLKIGRVPFLKLPIFEEPFRIATSLVRLRTWGLFNILPYQLMGTLHKIPVSRDPNAERLARLSGASVVISSSGFKCLLDNYDELKHPNPSGVAKSWILPVIVKEHRSFENGKPVTKTVVFIDKVLPPPKMTCFEKNYLYQKHALLAAVVHRHHEGGIQFETKGLDLFIKREMEKHTSEINTSEAKDEVPASTAIKDQEEPTISLTTVDARSQGTDENTTSTSQQPTKGEIVCDRDSSIALASAAPNQNEDQNDDSSDNDSLIIAFSDEESGQSHHSKPHKDHTVKTKIDTVVNVVAEDKTEVHDKSADAHHLKTYKPEPSAKQYSQMKSANEDIMHQTCSAPVVRTINGNALPFNITNVTYNLWCLQPHHEGEDSAPTECKSSGINMLIRSRIDGCEKMKCGNYEPLSVSSKPEFQLEYGAGVIPLSDLTRQWAKLIMQPESRLARVRVNVHNAEMVKVEKRTVADLENEAQAFYQEDLNNTLGTLYGVLADLVQLPCGEYILSHSPEMGLSAQLLVKADGEEAVDWIMSSQYGDTPQEIHCDTPWQPIDATAIMPRNEFFKQMPCTFQSRRDPKTNFKKHKPTQNQIKNEAAAKNYKKGKNAKKKAAKLQKANENKKIQE